jgi:hypothetical protein
MEDLMVSACDSFWWCWWIYLFWSGGTAATATGLSAGTYTVTVTDANACTASRNFIITQPTIISTATAAQTNVSCNGGSNGSASVTPSGGAGGYTYSWSPSGGTWLPLLVLQLELILATVTDANSCTATRKLYNHTTNDYQYCNSCANKRVLQ